VMSGKSQRDEMFIDASQFILVLTGFNRRLLGHFAPTELDSFKVAIL
jgi:hypothetical protein